MKKIITVCVFVFALLFSVQGLVAQEKQKLIDEKSKLQTEELTKVLGLDENQSALVWRYIYSREKAYIEKWENVDLDADAKMKVKASIDQNFKKNMITILTEEQFKTYSKWLGKQASAKY